MILQCSHIDKSFVGETVLSDISFPYEANREKSGHCPGRRFRQIHSDQDHHGAA